MTEQHPPLRDPHLEEVAHWHPIEGTPMKKRVAIGCSVGATIETYDFIGFGTAAALYFNTVFFPDDRPAVGHAAVVRDAGHRVRGAPAGRHHRRLSSATRSAASRCSSARCC